MMRHKNKAIRLARLLAIPALACAASTPARALDQIIKPYESVRSSGMGGVALTTGLYDDNFFYNPARVTANPTWRVTLLDPMVEFNNNVANLSQALDGGNSVYSKLGANAGDNFHARVQTTMPSVYIPPRGGKWAFAFGVITSSQFDLDLRKSYSIDPTGIIDIGPAVTVGRELLEDNALSVGATMHATYRLSTTQQQYSLVNLISGQSWAIQATGGQGGMIDFDLGMTYTFRHFHPGGVNLSVAAAMENLLGGGFNNLGTYFLKNSSGNPSPSDKPIPELRRGGFGFAVDKFSMGALKRTSLAIEVQDIGNNTNGSVFRQVHLGGETHLSIMAFRAGVNQGYFTGGFGLDLTFFTLDLSTYGEEMSLNPGGLEDRRYAARIAFQI